MEAHTHCPRKLFGEADEKFREIKDMLTSESALEFSHSELEVMLADQTRELTRLLAQAHLDLRRGLEEPPAQVVGTDGQARTHRRRRSRDLVCVFGLVQVARVAVGGRGMDSLMPMDSELNLPSTRYSMGVQRCLVEEAVRGSFDDAIAAVERTTGVRVPKRQAEEMVLDAAGEFDIFYAAGGGQLHLEDAPDDGLLVLTVDGKGITMRPDALREQTRKAAESSTTKLKKRLSKGEKRNRRRMATVASVYTVAPFPRGPTDIVRELRPVRNVEAPRPPRPHNKRVWASVTKDMETVIEEMFAEATRRDPDHRKRWVAVVDGNKTQLRLLKDYAAKYGVELTIILDVIHAIEYLWRATTAVHGEGKPETERIVTERLLKVLDGKAVDVAAGIKQSASKRELKGKKRKRVVKAADYLLTNAEFLGYGEFLSAGLPIASGVIEGTCRYLVKDRMDITGARWGLDMAEAVLKLRAMKASGDLEHYWRFYERQHWDRVHASRYEHEKPPITVPKDTPALRLLREAA